MKNALFNSEGVAFFLPRFARQTVARSLQEEAASLLPRKSAELLPVIPSGWR